MDAPLGVRFIAATIASSGKRVSASMRMARFVKRFKRAISAHFFLLCHIFFYFQGISSIFFYSLAPIDSRQCSEHVLGVFVNRTEQSPRGPRRRPPALFPVAKRTHVDIEQ